MRMGHHRHYNGPSLFSSLGQAFNFHHVPRYDISTVQPDPRVCKYQQFLGESLKSLSESYKSVPSLRWIHGAVVVVTSAVSEAQVFIPALNYPLSEFDEAWVSKYLEDTCRFLDVLNTIRKVVAEMEHKQMLLNLAVRTMGEGGVPEECRKTKVKKYLGEYSACVEKERCAVSKLEGCSRVLRDMCLEGATDENSKKNFLGALYGAKVVSASVLVIVILLFSGDRCLKSDGKSVTIPVSEEKDELKDMHVPEGYSWSKPLRELVSKVRESPIVIEEFKALESGLRSLEAKLEAPIMAEEFKGLRSLEVKLEEAGVGDEVRKLEAGLKSVEDGFDLVKQEMDRLFRVIVSNRNSLLCYLRLKCEEGCAK